MMVVLCPSFVYLYQTRNSAPPKAYSFFSLFGVSSSTIL